MNADYEKKKQLEPIFMGVFLLHCSFPASVTGWCQCVCQLMWMVVGLGVVQSDPRFLSCGFKWCGETAGDVQGLKKCFRRPRSDTYCYKRARCSHKRENTNSETLRALYLFIETRFYSPTHSVICSST